MQQSIKNRASRRDDLTQAAFNERIPALLGCTANTYRESTVTLQAILPTATSFLLESTVTAKYFTLQIIFCTQYSNPL